MEKGEPLKDFRKSAFLFDVLVTTIVFAIYGGTYCPDVNESHYICKAKNFWDSSFCAGDLFLESADAHWFFFATFGLATKFASLNVATWIGRWICWLTLAVGWCRLASTLAPLKLIGTFSSFLLIASVHYGQLSGEWIIGGCEAKCMAYGFAFLGLAATLRSDWCWTWIWCGLSMAYYVVTGGWITLALLGAVACNVLLKKFMPSVAKRLDSISPGSSGNEQNTSESIVSSGGSLRSRTYIVLSLCVAITFVLIGLIPALALNRDVDVQTAEKGAMIYVFARLPHHLRVSGFSNARWTQHGVLALSTIVMAFLSTMIYRRGIVDSNKEEASSRSLRVGLLLGTCFFSVMFAIAGALVDLTLSSYAPNWTANLLRYYWFRWNDVAWPVAFSTLTLLSIDRLARMTYQQTWRLAAQLAMWLITIVPGAALCIQRTQAVGESRIPPADSQSLIYSNTTKQRADTTYLDWLDACNWIRNSTPEGSLVLTPRNQQTFKWYAHRAEVVCWKDSPQNAKDLVEWYRRIGIVFPRAENGGPELLHQVRAIQLYREFRFDYVLTDKRSDPTPLAFPIVYENETFAIFRTLDL